MFDNVIFYEKYTNKIKEEKAFSTDKYVEDYDKLYCIAY